MSNRIDQEREAELEPKRFEFAKNVLEHLGYDLTIFPPKRMEFVYKGERVTLYPYSGWHTGKSIIDGRGIQKLLKQLR